MSAFALGYLFFQIPGGWLGNRFGTRFAFTFISVIWSLCNLWTAAVTGQAPMFAVRMAEAVASIRSIQFFGFSPLGFLPNIPAETLPMLSSRFFLGVFQAGLVPLSAKILKDWIPLRHRGMSSALIGASMSIGGVFTMWLTGWLLDQDVDWRIIFNVYSLVGVFWAIGFYWFFRTFPEQHEKVNKAELHLIRAVDSGPRAVDRPAKATPDHGSRHPTPTSLTGMKLWVSMFRCRSLWGLCVQSFFRAAGFAFFVTWFFAFLEYAYGISRAEAGLLNSMPLLAVVIGTMSGGVIVDRLLRKTNSKWLSRSATAFVSLMICGCFTMAAAWTSSATGLAIVISVGALFSGIGSPAAWAATIDIGGPHTALFVGAMNMAGCVAGVILPTVIGIWFDQILENGGNWNLVIYLHAAFYFSGALAWLAVNPNDTPTEPQDI
jgi:MFS family permease